MPYIKHLSKDKKLRPVIRKTGRLELTKRNDIFLYLCYSIMSQQLSTRVATVIRLRFHQLFDGRKPTPQQVLDLNHETLKSAGLSNAKVTYIQNVARFAVDERLTAKKLAKMNNEEVIAYLTRIKGVGRWTVEMLLMFALGREDVFATDDLGIQQAIIKLYRLKPSPSRKKLKQQMNAIAESWSPYRTYACMYLWRSKDDVG